MEVIVRCYGCGDDISDEEVYCGRCSGDRISRLEDKLSIRDRALKNLFSRYDMDIVEDMLDLTQLETITLRNECA